MENVPKRVKDIASGLIALGIGFIFTAVLFIAVGVNIKDHITFPVILVIIVMSLPIYVIIRKKMFK